MNIDIKFLNIEWRTRYSLTKFEDHFELHASVIFLDPVCVLSGSFVCCADPKLYRGQLAELMVYIIPLE